MIRLQERAMNHHQRIREFYSDLSAAQCNVGAVANGLAALISPIALINLAVGGVNLLASSSLKELEQKLTALKNKADELLNNL